MTTRAGEDAIGTPPRRPALVPADRYYSPAFAAGRDVDLNWGRNLDRYLDLPAQNRISGSEPGAGSP